MHPILFHLGSLPIFSYGVFVLLGTITLFFTALRLGRRANLTWEQLLPVACGVSFGAMVGARLG
jgi:prolipoprotein diacylglyceryltransferase